MSPERRDAGVRCSWGTAIRGPCGREGGICLPAFCCGAEKILERPLRSRPRLAANDLVGSEAVGASCGGCRRSRRLALSAGQRFKLFARSRNQNPKATSMAHAEPRPVIPAGLSPASDHLRPRTRAQPAPASSVTPSTIVATRSPISRRLRNKPPSGASQHPDGPARTPSRPEAGVCQRRHDAPRRVHSTASSRGPSVRDTGGTRSDSSSVSTAMAKMPQKVTCSDCASAARTASAPLPRLSGASSRRRS